jgi:hypothetical protein
METMTSESVASGDLTFEAENVTGSTTVTATFASDLPAGAVATALASRMSLPANVPWTLRSNNTAQFLDEEKPIGRQIEPGQRVTVTPKSHLG